MGFGKMGLGKTGFGEMGFGDTGSVHATVNTFHPRRRQVDSMFQKQCRYRDTVLSIIEKKTQFWGSCFPRQCRDIS